MWSGLIGIICLLQEEEYEEFDYAMRPIRKRPENGDTKPVALSVGALLVAK